MASTNELAINNYHQFLKGNSDFKIVYGLKEVGPSKRLLVLDSSFNPPHLGHYELLKKTIEFYNDSNNHVLLLLSVNNADKAPKPASFENRLQMISILNNILKSEGIESSVGVTTHAKFVDKNDAIRDSGFFNNDIVFLVGFDTITRIFDSKYYTPLLPAEALSHFMECTEICCLARADSISIEKQYMYPTEIEKGIFEPNIPSSWGHKIHILHNEKQYSNISSSNIRLEIKDGIDLDTLSTDMPLPIIEYLKNNDECIF
ncbi:hypothetical protein Kpol_2002p27 [Vanderwaltozyma polyspora DSM 70294]|uniref:Cytidyltransferase-like domain-containing protein n=1 Tax=Vanderwaltozyma polyspora (strain ATCC 22028 / DSM 70294 / BCRC 21397 / CBS 2163 / NBRC 10782 / NRRL Y-8283 / UCD 57-17) TaxID=436907 RepID=A7TFE3_VANPO|nr:uncharacterized protein Kpol_2002p27 [Vanderwaltozyma polyspora DSM 70294]EDO18957.1 hypothetical protein Kpol_2002p27 [Vanderwaltozyma polyspora DSM 70294]